ncbi:surface-anchored protein [Jiangella alkaliphila]|uniref:Surface-anchored protein n=2 Tax=Jiangella alkaliphila TaxID=419479 RepID=A0A1H2KJD2_9ACTN|nr:choice-of-anchor M domain-containing protein [Jiangella alkaliphila]SDU68508.1 surface-anchored protein [Jiangella alkaliphila]
MTRRLVPLLGAGLLTMTAAAGAAATGDPDLDQEIDADQPVATDQAVLSDGHVDIGPRYVDGAWTLLVHDDHAAPPTWRTVPATVFQVGDAALTPVPDNPDYAFLPAEPGTEVHVVPQAQRPDVIWVGWNTQDPTVMDSVDRGATLTLRGVQGPGDVVMFLQSGTLGEPEVLWDSREPYPQDVWVEVNTHTHANWVFAEPGVYLVEVEVSADLVSGAAEADTQVLRFSVGDATSTDEAFATEYAAAPEATDAPAPDATGSPAAAEDPVNDGEAPPLLAGVAGAAVLLVAVAVVAALRGRSAKRRARADGAP